MVAAIVAPACADDPPPVVPLPPPVATVEPEEEHFTGIVQITFHGDNRASRWSPVGDELLVATHVGECDRLLRSSPLPDKPSSAAFGAGRDPAYLPGKQGIVYATASKCPKEPDGGGILLDPDLDIFRAASDGSSPTQLTTTKGYDGEPGV